MKRAIPRLRTLGWGALGWGALGLGASALHFWHLGQPHALVFDEVYYVPFALDYLHGTPSFDAHPPLGKYFIALGLWLGQWPAAWLGWPTLEVEDAWVSPLAFRWLNALVGSTIPLLLAALADQLSSAYSPQRRRWFTGLAGVLMALEGLTLVESRLALINIYGLALGLLGQWAWLRAPRSQHPARWRWVAGIALGAAINVKWNWAGFWLGLLLWDIFQNSPPNITPIPPIPHSTWRPGWNGIPWRWVYLGIIPAATYALLWLPHLALTGESFWGVHRQLWSMHQSIGMAEHPYCSAWYGWPLMLRPVAYFYQRVEHTATTIHAMGNPVLWWLATAAVLALGLGWLARPMALVGWAKPACPSASFSGDGHGQSPLPILRSELRTKGVVPFIVINYVTNWLPWALVSRCTFLYHAMGMAAFSLLGLAWLMAQWLEHRRHRPWALALLSAIALSFWFWLPLYLGMPLSLESLHRRWLLPGWI